jgi:hypothetical protein
LSVSGIIGEIRSVKLMGVRVDFRPPGDTEKVGTEGSAVEVFIVPGALGCEGTTGWGTSSLNRCFGGIRTVT